MAEVMTKKDEMNKDEIRFIHIRHQDKNSDFVSEKGGITIAYTPSTITTEDDDTFVCNIGVSFCSKKDSFCRRTGRLISTGRLNKGNITIATSKEDVKSQIMNVLFHIANDSGINPDAGFESRVEKSMIREIEEAISKISKEE